MPEGVATGRFGEPCSTGGIFHRLLDHGFVPMVPVALASQSVDVIPRGRKDPLPRPFLIRVRVFALKGIRQTDVAQSPLQIALVLPSHTSEVLGKRLFFRMHSMRRRPAP